MDLSDANAITLNGVQIDGPVLEGVISLWGKNGQLAAESKRLKEEVKKLKQYHIIIGLTDYDAEISRLVAENKRLEARVDAGWPECNKRLQRENERLKGEGEKLREEIDGLKLRNAVLAAANSFNTHKLREHNAKNTETQKG